MKVVNKLVPLKIKGVKREYQSDWFNTDILQAIQNRDYFKAFHMYVEYKHAQNTAIFEKHEKVRIKKR